MLGNKAQTFGFACSYQNDGEPLLQFTWLRHGQFGWHAVALEVSGLVHAPCVPHVFSLRYNFSLLKKKSPRGDCWESSASSLVVSALVRFRSRLLLLRFKTHVRGAEVGPSCGGDPDETFSRHKDWRRRPKAWLDPRGPLRAAIRILHNFASTPCRRRRRRAWFTRTETYFLAGGDWAKLTFLIPSLLTSLLRGVRTLSSLQWALFGASLPLFLGA